MTKKLLLFLTVLLLTLSLAACGGPMEQLETLEAPSASSGLEQEPVSPTGFDGNLAGLCQYMEQNQAVTGEKVEMSYKEIGAVGGFRYRFKFNGSTVQAEFYEFDLDNQNAKAQECLSSVKEKGFFTILSNEVPAVLNGDFLMVYSDPSKDEGNTAQAEKVKSLFMDFKQ